VAVLRAVVYVAQKPVTEGDWKNCRTQLSAWQSKLAETCGVEVTTEGVSIEMLKVVETGEPVTTHEQADEIRDGFLEH
jgi:hypothetical protein